MIKVLFQSASIPPLTAGFRSVQTVGTNTAPQIYRAHILKSNFSGSGHLTAPLFYRWDRKYRSEYNKKHWSNVLQGHPQKGMAKQQKVTDNMGQESLVNTGARVLAQDLRTCIVQGLYICNPSTDSTAQFRRGRHALTATAHHRDHTRGGASGALPSHLPQFSHHHRTAASAASERTLRHSGPTPSTIPTHPLPRQQLVYYHCALRNCLNCHPLWAKEAYYFLKSNDVGLLRFYHFNALKPVVGRQEGHLACKKALVCWRWWSDYSFARLKIF